MYLSLYLVVGMWSLLCCIPEILRLLTERLWPMEKEPSAEEPNVKEVETENSKVVCKPLPQELITDILSRLPANSLYLCAKAYRDWNSFFSTHYFVHNLFLPRASPTIIVHCRPIVDDELFYLDDFGGDDKITPIDDPCICGCLLLEFSCFGLLFFSRPYLNYAVVFNPVTCEKTYIIHDCKGQTMICGVYYHPIAKEFCVLLVSRFISHNYVDFKLLRERGPSRSWIKLSHSPVTLVPPVNLNGALHWMRLDMTPCSHSIVSFSIVEEEFKLMPHPAVVPVLKPDGKSKKETHLFDLNGKLALCQIEDVLEIWTLESYTSWFWTKTHSIEVEGLDHLRRSLSVLVLGTQNGALIIHVIGKGTFTCHFQPKTQNGALIFHEFKGSTDMTVNGLSCSEQLATTTVSSDPHNLVERNLKLISGSCYLPHPDKKETGGEDAHFICVNEQVIGVADGVGGWADVGVNAGLYARELMSNSVGAILNEPKDSIDPARVLTRAHSATKAKGSSTACIICLKEEGIHAINLGDSGFIIVRDGCTVFESPVQQHGFNFTYQLECSSRGDQPSSGQVFMIPVVPGDVIVAGTDGLFDNLFNDEVISIVADGMREGQNPASLSQKLATSAQQRGLDRHKQTPFSTAAKEAGFRYYGGKLDDITVIVSYISSSTN